MPNHCVLRIGEEKRSPPGDAFVRLTKTILVSQSNPYVIVFVIQELEVKF